MAVRLDESDEYMHELGPEPNFNESMYINAFDPAQGVGGWFRMGNRANEGTAEMTVCLYLPPSADGEHLSNSDPVTGQAGWYDVRVKIYPAADDEPEETYPQFKAGAKTPGTTSRNKFISGRWLKYFAGKKVN